METVLFTPTGLLEDQRLLTADEFEAMVEAGLFTDEHVELIQGRIIMLLAQGPHHLGRVNWLTMLFTELLAEAYGPGQRRVAVQVQSTTRISRHDVPEADLALLDAQRAFSGSPPDPERDVYLVVEVADTSLRKDLSEKSRVYAAAGVPLLWVLDVPHRRLHVFRKPDRARADYLERQAHEEGEVRIETLDALPPIAVETLFQYMDPA